LKTRIYGRSNQNQLHSTSPKLEYFDRDSWSKALPQYCTSGDQDVERLQRSDPRITAVNKVIMNVYDERQRKFEHQQTAVTAFERDRNAVHNINELLQYQFSGGNPPSSE
jgi:hypothetical protein